MSALVHDGTAMLGRHLRRIRRAPGVPVLTQTMPITMLLFFGYVFGSALAMPGGQYRAYLLPGLLAATASNGIMTGMFQAAQDSHRGVMDRFRTMPVSRAAVPLGQTAADTLLTAAGMVPLALVGLAVGWRIEGGPLHALAAFGVLLLFRLATSRSAAGSDCSSTTKRPRASWAAPPSSFRCSPAPTSRRTECRDGCGR